MEVVFMQIWGEPINVYYCAVTKWLFKIIILSFTLNIPHESVFYILISSAVKLESAVMNISDRKARRGPNKWSLQNKTQSRTAFNRYKSLELLWVYSLLKTWEIQTVTYRWSVPFGRESIIIIEGWKHVSGYANSCTPDPQRHCI